jgi:hypothetical protein
VVTNFRETKFSRNEIFVKLNLATFAVSLYWNCELKYTVKKKVLVSKDLLTRAYEIWQIWRKKICQHFEVNEQ